MSFKDAFTKDQGDGNPLNYDDSAFAYFASTCLTCVLVPWAVTYMENRLHIFARSKDWILRWRRQECNDPGVSCTCSLCERKRAALDSEVPLWQRFAGSSWDLAQLIILLSLSILLAFICKNYLSNMPSVGTFNPYEILNIVEGATDREIRKAFRTMSLKFHPDKNPNDASAAAKFVLISKAYQALTDEIGKRNFEKYGNPDGRSGMMRVGIGLPQLLINERFQILILATFFISLLVILPGCFLLYFHIISKYAANGLRKETVHMIAGTMTPKISAHRAIAMIASSNEIRKRPYETTPDDLVLLKVMCNGKNIDRMGMLSESVLKACLLIYVHLARQTHLLPRKLQAETRDILREANKVSKAMLDIAFINNWIPSIQTILAVRKCLFQAVEIGGLPVIQMPHILLETSSDKPEPQERFSRAKNLLEVIKEQKPADFKQVMEVALAQRDKALKDMTDQEVEDIRIMSATIPDLKFEGAVHVEDEEDICAGDVATCTLKITRQHLRDGQRQGSIHAPYYPDMQKEEWYVFIADAVSNDLYGYKIVRDDSKEVTCKILFPIVKPGEWKITAVCLAGCYFGADRTCEISFTAVPPAESKYRREFVHPDDVALDTQAGLIQQMLGTAGNEEDEEEEEEEVVVEEVSPKHAPDDEPVAYAPATETVK